MDKSHGPWDEIYHDARKSEKLKFEANERDEGELERTGQPVCIYEIYDGAGAWPFLNHGSLYRGLSLVSFFQPYLELIFFGIYKEIIFLFSTYNISFFLSFFFGCFLGYLLSFLVFFFFLKK
jgi:hypothetical protein